MADEVVETGSAVTRFAAGDRVVGHALGYERSNNRAAEGAFQLCTVLSGHMAAPVPDEISVEPAAVLPLGLSTAASGLFERPVLGLELPTASPASTEQPVLVWGGSTSVGGNAIQLAINAVYNVVTTASPRNFAYTRGLGAGEVFDYHSDTAVKDLIRFLAQAPPLARGDRHRARVGPSLHGDRGRRPGREDPRVRLTRYRDGHAAPLVPGKPFFRARVKKGP